MFVWVIARWNTETSARDIHFMWQCLLKMLDRSWPDEPHFAGILAVWSAIQSSSIIEKVAPGNAGWWHVFWHSFLFQTFPECDESTKGSSWELEDSLSFLMWIVKLSFSNRILCNSVDGNIICRLWVIVVKSKLLCLHWKRLYKISLAFCFRQQWL